MSNRPTAVLFDWDGTLVNSGDILLQCWHQVTTAIFGAPFPVTEADRRKFLSMRGSDSFPLLSDDPAVVQALEDGFTEAYLALAVKEVRAYPDSHELLAALRAAGVGIGVVTSKTMERMARDIDVCGLAGTFDVVVTGDDVKVGKPDPEGVLAALAALGASAENSVMVGDGPVDVRAGRAAGVETIGITHGLHSSEELVEAVPDVLVASLGELRERWGL